MSVRSKRESYNLSGSTFLVTASGMTLKLPIPSKSNLDPLNWGQWKAAGAICAVAWYFVAASTVVQAPSIILLGITRDFGGQDIRPWSIESVVTAPTLLIGIGALLWLPLSLALGRRPAFLIAALMMPLASLGAGFSTSFHSLFACVCLLGLGQGFSVTSSFLMIIDLTYIHQRTRAIAALWALLGGRQFYHYWTIPMGMAFLLAFFLYPETYFKRPTVAFDGMILLQSATEKLTVYKDTDTDSGLYRDLPDLPCDRYSNKSVLCGLQIAVQVSQSPVASWGAMRSCYIQMAHCLVNPLLFWVFIVSAVHWAGILFIGSSYTNVLRSPPYELPSSLIININTASAAGAFLAYPVGGYLTDSVLQRMAQRNRGVREAEHYLIGYIPTAVIGAGGALLYGFAVHYKLHYSLLFISCGLEGFSWITLCITNTLWLTEAFPRWAAPAVAVSGGATYILSFGLGYTLVPWIKAHGFKFVGIELAVLQLVAGLVAVPVAFWGKSARQAINGKWSSERSGALRPL
ncbi:hypothetical protein E8E12_005810 [Didymella heteroderae]|uniref:MFS general substrate transporter n=1 Tax=Didymella heteroderae TaxID=1769908 RepID=A0A9P4WTY1_9PLEO|nr:hypothetical protein E8E12_005810 [Didymella heteroderae]